MPNGNIKILLIEDNAGDARAIRETLEEEQSTRFNLVHATRLQTGLERLAEGDIDVALIDLTLPDSRGLDTFNQVLAHSPHVPIIVLTGIKNEAAEIQVLQAGGQDFLNKGFLNLSVIHQSIRHAMLRKQAAGPDSVKNAVVAANHHHDQFLGMLGDELRAPLTVMLSTVRALTQQPGTNAELLPTLATFRRYLEREARLIDDLLTYSRVGTRRAVARVTACEIVLERAVANLKALINDTGAVVTHDPLPTLSADDTQIGQVFQNLIESAIKSRGNDRPLIHFAASRQGEEWVFSVRDNGIGVDPRHVERLFFIFRRAQDKDQYPGAGIGLAICKKIVERHDGRIWAESEPGQGACFFFALPATDDREHEQ